VKKRCAKAVNVAAKVLRLAVQSLGRDIRRRSPDHAVALYILRILRGKRGEAKVANLHRLFIDKQNVCRLYVSMNQPLAVSRAKASRDLDANVEHLVFRHAALHLHEIVKTPVIDQFHHHVKLAVVRSQGEDLNNIGMIYRCRDACFLLQFGAVILFVA
jgi:hypothetical protein